MSNFRTRARDIKAAGEAERGNFEPTGLPLRIYKYWLNESSSTKARRIAEGAQRENFCHFWRVVAIWAPLLFLGRKIETIADANWFPYLVGAVILSVLFWAIWISHGAVGLVLLLIAAIILASVGIVFGVAFLHERFWKKSYTKTFWNIVGILLGTAIVGVVVFGIVSLIIDTGWMGVLYLATAALTAVAVVVVLSKIATYLSGKRAIEREKREAAREQYYRTGEPNEYFGKASRPKSKFDKFVDAVFSGIGDFLILAFQVVRVKKWKICPMVSIEDK